MQVTFLPASCGLWESMSCSAHRGHRPTHSAQGSFLKESKAVHTLQDAGTFLACQGSLGYSGPREENSLEKLEMLFLTKMMKQQKQLLMGYPPNKILSELSRADKSRADPSSASDPKEGTDSSRRSCRKDGRRQVWRVSVSGTEGAVTLQKWVKKVGSQNNRTCGEQTERAWTPTWTGATHAEANPYNCQHTADVPKQELTQS